MAGSRSPPMGIFPISMTPSQSCAHIVPDSDFFLTVSVDFVIGSRARFLVVQPAGYGPTALNCESVATAGDNWVLRISVDYRKYFHLSKVNFSYYLNGSATNEL